MPTSSSASIIEELKLVSQSIDKLLLTHPFPDQVQPDWLREQVLSYPKAGGKRLRPALTLWCCELFSSDKSETALRPAAAAELFHTWTLVHDDIIDRDDFRRGTPTCHRALSDFAKNEHKRPQAEADHFGLSMGILAGDLQQAWSMKLMLESPKHGLSYELANTLSSRLVDFAYTGVLAGEAIDVEFEHRQPESISFDEALKMIELKTAVLLRYSAEIGAMIGLDTTDLQNPLVQACGDFAQASGMAFQLQDDLLGLFADEKLLGKPVGSDLLCGKVTPLMCAARELLPQAELDFINALAGKEKLSTEDLLRAQQSLRDCGAITRIEELMKTNVQQAANSLAKLPAGATLDKLHLFNDFMINRKH